MCHSKGKKIKKRPSKRKTQTKQISVSWKYRIETFFTALFMQLGLKALLLFLLFSSRR